MSDVVAVLLALLACGTADLSPVSSPPVRLSAPDSAPVSAPMSAVPSPTVAPEALPESDLPFSGTGRWALGGHVFTLTHGTLYADGVPIVAGVYDDPVAGVDTLWVPADLGDGDGGIYAVRPGGLDATGEGGAKAGSALTGSAPVVTALLTGGRPDRLALAPDGATLVYVAGTSGITSLWRIAAAGGAPRQLTNVGVRRPPTPGRAPSGFVPPPTREPLRFDGDRLVWTAASARHEVPWR